MANRNRSGEREFFWREVVKRYTGSGLSVRVFCRQEHLTESAFYAWRRTIAQRDAQAQPRPVSRPLKTSTTFVPALVTDTSTSERSIVLELAGGRALRLPASISVERLVQFVQALEAGGTR